MRRSVRGIKVSDESIHGNHLYFHFLSAWSSMNINSFELLLSLMFIVKQIIICLPLIQQSPSHTPSIIYPPTSINRPNQKPLPPIIPPNTLYPTKLHSQLHTSIIHLYTTTKRATNDTASILYIARGANNSSESHSRAGCTTRKYVISVIRHTQWTDE